MIHLTQEAIHAEQQERLRVAGQQRLIAAAAAEHRRQRRAAQAARPSQIRRAVRALRQAAAEGLRAHTTSK
ncbi:hypothetical protein [Streptomyces spororaveus]|uniref:hypothetical protein n=1 Tax=Streptomyces spororaveus TaxID=284039 RepID=UPI0019220CC2|nr:hypothetical protein [Streptomyces spororaveus]